MNLSAPFIRRPIATSLLAVALLLAGLVAFENLPVSPLPRVDMPTININAALPGGSPETMATAVAMPLERRFGRIAGVNEITSTSSLGTTSITVQFDLDRDVESCARDVQAAINAAGGDLPANLPTRPNYRKVNPADAPILILSLRSKSVLLPRVFEEANTKLAQKIAQVEGVGQVGVGGGVQPAVRVQADPAALAGLGLSMEDVRNALTSATANSPKGGVGTDRWSSIGTDDQLLDAKAWGDVIVHWTQPQGLAAPVTMTVGSGLVTGAASSTSATNNTSFGGAATVAPVFNTSTAKTPGDAGGAVRLGDIAKVTDDVENQRVAGWFDQERTVAVIIRRQPGANILDVIDRVKALLPEMQREIRPGIDISVAVDRATTIRASVHDVERTLVISIGLVVLVVFLFLRSGRATSIPSVVVPLSLIGTFGVMYLLHYSIDNLSLMAMTIATGFVVDDAIVVTENVVRHLDAGLTPTQAALKGAQQIGFTIVSITCSLLAVFIPLLFMGGQVGRLFREFAMVLAISITMSALISLTLTPMMCAKVLKPRANKEVFAGVVRVYAAALRWVLRHRIFVGVIAIGTIVATVFLFKTISVGLFPDQDTGMITGSSLGPQDISFPSMLEAQKKLNGIVASDPDVAHVVSNIGGFGSSTGNAGTMFIALKDKPARTSSAEEVIARIRAKTAKVDNVQFFMRSVQDVSIGGRASRTGYQYTLETAKLAELDDWVPKVMAALRKLPQLKDVNSDQQTAGLQLSIDIDRDMAARFGITPDAIDNTLYDAFGQRQVATFFTQVNQYRVVLEASPSIGTGPEALDQLYISAADGSMVPLSQLVRTRPSQVALSISHNGQFPANTVSFNLAPGASLGDAVTAINAATAKIGMPASINAKFSGTAQAFKDSMSGMLFLVLLAIGAVYIVLGVLYESYIHPITILSTIPSAGLGALCALLMFGSELNLIAMVGLILLIGIVKKNAILMIDFAIELEKEGKEPAEAIYEAARLRFRPIVMTTLAALLGALPLALGSGTGSELRRPLGIAIVGGLLVSQVLTLFTTPVVYLALHRFARKKRLPY